MDGNNSDNFPNSDLEIILSVLPKQATLEQAREFLKMKGLAHSAGNWPDMIESRFKAYHDSKQLSVDEISNFLGESEEFGKQHVLLYTADKKILNIVFDQGKLKAALLSDRRFPELNKRNIVSLPDKATIVEVVQSAGPFGKTITIKIIEKRHHTIPNEAVEYEEDGYLIRKVPTEPYRAANIVRIHENGLCEVRIHSHSQAVDYSIEATGVIRSLAPVINERFLTPFSLEEARSYIWTPAHRDSAKAKFTVRASEHIDGNEGRLRPSISGIDMSMLDNPGLVGAIDSFHNSTASVQRANLFVKPSELLNRPISLNLSGADNEFFLTARINRAEYDHILKVIIASCEAMKS